MVVDSDMKQCRESNPSKSSESNSFSQSQTDEKSSDKVQESNKPVGKQWILYINNKRQDWQTVCEKGRIVNKKDDILWKFEYPPAMMEEYSKMQQEKEDLNNIKGASAFQLYSMTMGFFKRRAKTTFAQK